jgi:glycosyltransferase involved in cell wall biosynthesis
VSKSATRVTVVADYSSPITRQWTAGIASRGISVRVLSTVTPGAQVEDLLESVETIARPLDSLARRMLGRRSGAGPGPRVAGRWPMLGEVRRRLTPLAVRLTAQAVAQAVAQHPPDLVHALRIPSEGMVAARAVGGRVPLLISVWGNDLTWLAASYPAQGKLTRMALGEASGLLADCERDRKLAQAWGFDGQRPSAVLPGAGGVDMTLFGPGPPSADFVREHLPAHVDGPVIFDPRGIRGYVRTKEFIEALPLVLASEPRAHVLCAGMQGYPWVETLVTDNGLQDHVTLLPHLSRAQMAEAFRSATVSVSLSVHDGTPNSLLEAMASGCFPVAGRLDSVAEWVTDGVNGLLCDPDDPRSIADRLLTALGDESLRHSAAAANRDIISSRAEYDSSMDRAVEFYEQVIANSPSPSTRGAH